MPTNNTAPKRAKSDSAAGSKMLTVDNMNPNVVKMEYAVRGPLVIRATEIEKELQAVSDGICLSMDVIESGFGRILKGKLDAGEYGHLYCGLKCARPLRCHLPQR